MTEGRLRRDPFAERQRLRVPGASRPRLDLAATGMAAVEQLVRPPPAPIAIDLPACLVLVVPDAEAGHFSTHDLQLLGAARQLADAASGAVVVLAGFRDPAFEATAAQAGADRLAVLPSLAEPWPEQRAAAVAMAIEGLQPRHVLFAESLDGGDLARRVAVLTGEILAADVEALSPRAAIRATAAHHLETSQPPPLLLCLQPGRALPYAGLPHAWRLQEWQPQTILPAPVPEAAPELVAGDPATLKLSEAPFVVAAGNGVTDFDLFRRLVASLGATPGGSRVVCDAGMLPRTCQVGASGTILQGSCYIALGISGSPQHLQGVGQVGHVIAVNTDLHAAMVERAELAIIADAQAVSEALLRTLERRNPA